MTDYARYINSTGTHYISNSGHDENNRYHSGTAGDQTKHEYELRSWYNRPWTVVLRHPDAEVRQLIAQYAIDAALNNLIGYDQYQRNTMWRMLEKYNYEPAKIATACEADCTASTTAIIKAVGHKLWRPELEGLELDTYSGNMRPRLVKIGFTALTASKYTGSYQYLQPGDVLLYEGHHAAINVTQGKYADNPVVVETIQYKFGDRILKNGMSGADVKALQEALRKLEYDLGSWGCDGDFGDCTELAVRRFQTQHDLVVDGQVGPKTIAALQAALAAANAPILNPTYVVIEGGNCYVRENPVISDDNIIGVAFDHTQYLYGGKTSDNGWHNISYKERSGWVSGKYGRLK